MNYAYKIEEEDGLEFKTVRIIVGDYDHFHPQEFMEYGLYKIITTIDNVNRTYYYKDKIESSKEKIFQEERIKNLRR